MRIDEREIFFNTKQVGTQDTKFNFSFVNGFHLENPILFESKNTMKCNSINDARSLERRREIYEL